MGWKIDWGMDRALMWHWVEFVIRYSGCFYLCLRCTVPHRRYAFLCVLF
jgi:hypothetical protein